MSDEPRAQGIDLFAKCRNFTAAREVMGAGIYPFFHPSDPCSASVAVIQGKPRVMLGSNNYLGLTHHPEVIHRAREATARYGTGCTGSRFLNGTLALHEQLEGRLATFLSQEAALVFSTGYQANLGVVSALVAAADVIVQDRLCHASLVDGARLARGRLIRFPHGDLSGLQRILEKHSGAGGVLCVTDGIFSMEGDLPDLPAIAALTKQYGARLLVDDAHAVGVLGTTGRGSAEHFGVEVDLVTITFSKSFASIGGAVAGPEEVIHYLRHHARALIFTASMPPAAAATVLACLDVMEAEPERRHRLWENAEYLRAGLRSLGFDTGPSASPIIPIVIGGMAETFTAWKTVFDAGVFVNAVTPPAVDRNACRLRLSAMATHTRDQLDLALEAFGALRSHRRPRSSTRSVHVRELGRSDSLARFIELPWRVNSGDQYWVPPLRRRVKALLDRTRHPFHRHADVAYFTAERGNETVGRVAAIVNRSHNEFHRDHTGFFGFFDAVNDDEVAGSLVETAATWLRERGLDRVVGPVSFSTNEECGLLVAGFDTAPAVMMPHNPPYYPELLDRAGLRKEKDLLAYRLADGDAPLQRLTSGLSRIRIEERLGIRVRPLDVGQLVEELRCVRELYHDAWRNNWGFVPMTGAEFDHLARELKPIIDPDLCLLAENGDGPIGFSIALPDVNQALRTLNGRLFPFGFLQYLIAKRKIDNLRILTLGVAPSVRRRGVDAALYMNTWLAGRAKGYRTAEASWILEDNWPMRRALERLGGCCFRTYRIYSREL